MQIRLRPSGGRGEYELAGSHGPIKGSDLYGLELEFDFGLDLRIPLYAVADVHDGKARIRLDDPRTNSHAAKVIAALLLMPQPIREIRETGGTARAIDFKRCAFSSIVVDVVTKNASNAVLRPRTIVAINGQAASATIDVLNRFEFIKGVWSGLLGASAQLNNALAMHQGAADANPLNHKMLIAAAEHVLSIPGASVLLTQNLALPVDGVGALMPPPIAEDDPSSPIDVNRELRKRLAWRAERGVDGRRFRQAVSDAYRYKCVFTGESLPSLGKGYLPGIDAAHIYPWSRQGSNQVTNGISLSKQMHWAFDEGILRLKYAAASSVLVIDMPADIAGLARVAGFDLDAYVAVCGPIPVSHLPNDASLWPSRKSLALYNELMFPTL
ncbi:HNH endonuclease [Polaromonas sp.]|uniref:HNH endonuclease n=1 Tax=Polaromonas sp. TaxID=1869339 RepID=UPI0035699376